jgi:hypothetical protein
VTVTYGDTITKVHRRLLSGVREQWVTLSADYTAGSPSMSVSTASPFFAACVAGSRLSVDEEVFLVEAATSGGSLTVIPGYEGSAEADHASGALANINPRFTRYDCGVAVNDDLMDLSSPDNGLGSVVGVDITYNPVFSGYPLPAPFNTECKVLEISYKIAPPTYTFPLIRQGDYRVIRGQSDPRFAPTGCGVIIYKEAWPGLPMRVQYLAPFNPLVNLTDSLTDVAGLPDTATDLPALGAQLLLIQPREVKRNFMEAQPDPRKAPEVPPGAVMGSSKALEAQRQRRIDAEASRIGIRYPFAESF